MSADADRIGVATADLWADITREIHDFSPRPVGFGGYSDIYTAIWRSAYGDMKVAVKVIRAAPTHPETGELPRALRREISVWKRLLHPNIHVMCGFYEGFGSAPALVSPWYENGDINEYTRRRAARPDIALLKLKLFADVVTGLKFLHDHNIVHGDIKGGNILISDDGVARLCDFGLSHVLFEHSQSTTSTGGTGTSRWMAPELHLVEGARHTCATDIWACGCLFIEVWSNVLPYHTKSNEKQVMLALWQQELPARPSEMPDIIWTIVQECCNFDVASRPQPLRVGAYISHHLNMQRVHPMVTRGHLLDPVESQILRDIDSSLQAADAEHLSSLYILSDTELVAEILRILATFSLSSSGGSLLFEDAVFKWLLVQFRPTGSLLLPGGIIPPNTYNDNFDTFYEVEKLHPLARLVERGRPGLAIKLMTQFAMAALGPPLQTHARVNSVSWLSDGMRVAAGCIDGNVRILDVAGGATLHELVGHTESVNQVAVAQNGKLLASCSTDKSIRLWDAEIKGVSGFDPVISRCSDTPLAEIGIAIGAPMVGHTDHVWSVAFSPDARHIVSGSSDHTTRIWCTDTCTTVLGPLLGHTSTVTSVAYSPDGSRIVSGSWDDTVRVWDARMGEPILTLSGHTYAVRSVAYSPDGSHIVSGSEDFTVRIWDAETGQHVGSPLEGQSHWVRSVAYSPDGTRIVSGSCDRTICIWDAATGAAIATIRGHTGWVYCVAFSPDGTRLASASSDGTVRIWNAKVDWRLWDI